jgi:raffinose/stachyose/melibiose transport system permease protein
MIWVGLLHFKRLMLESDAFWVALRNNLFIMFVVPMCVVPLAMFLAVCLSRGVWGSTLFRVVFLFPNLVGGVAASLLWMHLYNPNGGLINDLLVRLGFTSFDGFAWLSADNLYYALIPIMVWGACGFNMILYLAAMQNVPDELYEAAELEGASPLRQFWTITLPLIWDVLTISVIFMVIAGMKSFEIVWLLTNQRPTTATHTVGTRLVQVMLNEFNIGEAAAIGVLLFLLVFVGTALGLRVMKRETVER